MWTEGADIGEPETLVAAGERVGLDPAELKTALDDRTYAQRALDAVQQAHRIGITNTPTIFLGKTRINGWTYYEVLQSVMEGYGLKPREALTS
jgi:predicted DsbA family dithiol-disulfide isomerase